MSTTELKRSATSAARGGRAGAGRMPGAGAAGTRGWHEPGSSPRASRSGSSGCSRSTSPSPAAGRRRAAQGALHTLAGSTLGKALLVLLATRVRRVRALARRAGGRRARGRRRGEGAREGLGQARRLSRPRRDLRRRSPGRRSRSSPAPAAGESQNQKAHKTTATVLDWPAGRWLVAIAGVVVAGVGLWNLYRGVARKFEDKWRSGEMSATQRRWASRVGLAGHVGALRRLRADRRLRHEGGARVRPEGGDRDRRRAPEARACGLRAVAARPHRRRARLLRRVLPRRRPLPGRLRRLAGRLRGVNTLPIRRPYRASDHDLGGVMRKLGLALVLGALCAAALGAGRADASPYALYGIQDDAWIRYGDGSVTERAMQLKSMGVGIVRYTLRWDEVAAARPGNARNPGDPKYRWSAYDEIFGALARGEDPGRRDDLRRAALDERRPRAELGADGPAPRSRASPTPRSCAIRGSTTGRSGTSRTSRSSSARRARSSTRPGF